MRKITLMAKCIRCYGSLRHLAFDGYSNSSRLGVGVQNLSSCGMALWVTVPRMAPSRCERSSTVRSWCFGNIRHRGMYRTVPKRGSSDRNGEPGCNVVQGIARFTRP
jgi:hypothetical protein